MHTIDGVEGNVERIAALFPNCVTEAVDEQGNLRHVVDFDKLKVELGEVVEGNEERYQFTWPGKRDAIRLANSPIAATLRPVREDSVDFDNTQNLYIEGDNLDVLKLLRETYLGKVKMIYIDPPYNTGNDFVYEDDFSQAAGDYLANSGQFDDQGNRLVANTESNGRFHTDWLNMIYPRLKVARDLLTEDGMIFISIDDNEVENLMKICIEIFGESNVISPFIWPLPRGINAGLIARAHEYVICITKNINTRKNFFRVNNETEYSIERCNKKIDSRHPESVIEFTPGIRYEGKDQVIEGIIEGSERITIIGKLEFRDGKLVAPVKLSAGWTMKNMILDWMAGKPVYDLKGQPIIEFFFKENGRLYSKKEMQTFSIKSVLKDIPDSQIARTQIEDLFGSQDVFSYPKPIEMSMLLAKLCTKKDDIILDFFSGSSTTAHAVMQLNSEDHERRKYIMVQIPEETEESSEACKLGFTNICEIGKERIRRAGKKIKADAGLMGQDLDIGFRVLRLDSSNMEDVYYTPDQFDPNAIQGFIDNVKHDRTDEDLLFQVMLEHDIPLSASIKREQIAGKHVFNVADGHLIATFDRDVNETTVMEIAKQHPNYFVMRDASAANDNVLDNFEQIFRHYSPDTTCKIL